PDQQASAHNHPFGVGQENPTETGSPRSLVFSFDRHSSCQAALGVTLTFYCPSPQSVDVN
ncbi:MAG TPA: hypothetical protein VFZ59_08720, partial [Verrucomicrobiae bacterium]|nr:hypothetical protein [Verrucomicrobiae bacterium]